MKVFKSKENSKRMEGVEPLMMHEHINPGRPIPPHERNALMHIEFEGADWELFHEIFKDEDTAMAAADIISEIAPPEVRILAVQLMDLLGDSPKTVMKFAPSASSLLPRHLNPVLGEDAQQLYAKLYGETGNCFVDILNTAPYEMAVISRLIAFLSEKRGVEDNGRKEDC